MDHVQSVATTAVTVLQQRVRLAMQSVSFNELADSLCYQNCGRLYWRMQVLLTSSSLGIDGSGTYDFKYSSAGFIRTVCHELGIEADIVADAIQAVEDQRDIDRESYKAYLFVDTDFRRTTQPVWQLAMMERYRRIPLSVADRRLPLYQQPEVACKLARDHYSRCEGVLPVWGEIKQYLFYYAGDQAVVIGVHGNLTGIVYGAVPSRATVCIGGKDFDNLGISPLLS
ncbi:hypothetical protein [Solemya velum gill symbiont]|nr:hypothetical protein [Solemya velum gill symbiont]